MSKLFVKHSFILELPNMWAISPQQQKQTKFQWIENAQPITYWFATRIAFETPRVYHHFPKWPLKFILILHSFCWKHMRNDNDMPQRGIMFSHWGIPPQHDITKLNYLNHLLNITSLGKQNVWYLVIFHNCRQFFI
jgi:hypothetical protein